MLNIHNIEKSNYVNGNGRRYVIWAQGCNLHCKGCWNTETWSFENRILLSPNEIFEDIIKQEKLDGVTLTGGEPFLQPESFAELAYLLKKHTKLNLQIFTGFNIEELNAPYQIKLHNLTDILVCGRFDKTKVNNNQVVYNSKNSAWKFNNSDIEVDIDENGSLLITGYPTNLFIQKLKGSTK